MHSRNEPRACRTVLAAAVATVTVLASFGTVTHADDDPVVDAPVEVAEGDGVVVAVGPPPVPPTSVVVAVAPPPVPPTSVVAAVAPPPVPPTSVVVAVAPPPVTPVSEPIAPAVRSFASSRSPRPADVARIADVIVDVAATVHGGLALLDSRL